MKRYKILEYIFEIEDNVDVIGVEMGRATMNITTDHGVLVRKPCRQCKKLLPLEEFYARKSPCRRCHRVAVKRWRKNNPERDKAHKKVSNHNLRQKQRLAQARIQQKEAVQGGSGRDGLPPLL